jgi:hypothetical protein
MLKTDLNLTVCQKYLGLLNLTLTSIAKGIDLSHSKVGVEIVLQYEHHHKYIQSQTSLVFRR